MDSQISSTSRTVDTVFIVPYRDREEQLKIFVPFMNFYLKKYNLQYRIAVIEQENV